MAKSMTGYGRGEFVSENQKIVLEIKSVNHRYSDINIKLPRAYIFLEDHIRKIILDSVSRGKIDVFLTVEGFGDEVRAVKVDEGLLNEYFKAMAKISEVTGVDNDATSVKLAHFSDVLVVEKQEEDKEKLKTEITEALTGALADFVAARQREGERIKTTLVSQADYILDVVEKINIIMPQTVEEYRLRLTAKLKELLGDTAVDESRVLTEAAIVADRICTDEEIVRLRSHITEFKNILNDENPIGRRLDFIVQEMNREINTIGSKSNNLEIAKYVVEVKSEIEKLREQVQNIE